MGSLVIGSASFGLRLAAQQQEGALTPPPKPAMPKLAASAATGSAPFEVGERLSFNVAWANFVTAARLELEVANQGAYFGRESYQLRTKVETVGYVRSIFTEVDNQYTSYVDLKTMLPYRVENSTQQGQKREDDLITFDQQARSARYADGSTLQLPTNTYDLPSLLYALRLRELKSGASYKYSALFGKEIIQIEALVKQRERVITQAGSYDALRVEIAAKGSKANLSKYRVRAWFSDDAQRLPVLLTAQPPFGEVRAELSHATLTVPPRTRLSAGPTENTPLIVSKDKPPADAFEVARGEAPSEFERNLPFAVGERLSYDVSWLNMTAVGKASFEVRQQGRLGKYRVFELAGEAYTIGAARSLINLHDQLISYVNVENLLPMRHDIRLREGQRLKQTSADYDWSAKSARLSNGTVVALQPRTFDLTSLFYAIRAADLKLGATHTFPLLDANHRLRALTVKVIKQETISCLEGSCETAQLDIINQQTQQLIAQAWVSTDARRLPIYIAARFSFGELRFQLTNALNTR
jgi:hypothetical protein